MKQPVMVLLLLLALGLGVVLNFIMTVLGLVSIFDADGGLGYMICAALAFMILTLKLSTEVIYSRLNYTLYRWMYAALWGAIILDIYAVFNSVVLRIIMKQGSNPVAIPAMSAWSSGALPLRIFSIALIIFLVGAPIAFALLLRARLHENEK